MVRTNIELDDALIQQAMSVSGMSTKRAVVEEGLRRMVAAHRQRQAIREMHGLGWEGGEPATLGDAAA